MTKGSISLAELAGYYLRYLPEHAVDPFVCRLRRLRLLGTEHVRASDLRTTRQKASIFSGIPVAVVPGRPFPPGALF